MLSQFDVLAHAFCWSAVRTTSVTDGFSTRLSLGDVRLASGLVFRGRDGRLVSFGLICPHPAITDGTASGIFRLGSKE